MSTEDFKDITEDEMTDSQRSTFRKLWIKERIEDLIRECGCTREDAEFHGEHDWERFVGQAGFEARDEKIRHQRDMARGIY